MDRLTANFLTLLCFGIENSMSCRLWLCTLSTFLYLIYINLHIYLLQALTTSTLNKVIYPILSYLRVRFAYNIILHTIILHFDNRTGHIQTRGKITEDISISQLTLFWCTFYQQFNWLMATVYFRRQKTYSLQYSYIRGLEL